MVPAGGGHKAGRAWMVKVARSHATTRMHVERTFPDGPLFGFAKTRRSAMRNLAKLWSSHHSADEGRCEGDGSAAARIDGSASDATLAELESVQHLLTEILDKAAQGDFGGRIPQIDDGSPIAPMLHAFNRLFERMEGFLNELETRMLGEPEGFSRQPPPERFRGPFARTLTALDALLAHMAEREREEKAFRENQANSFDETFSAAQMALASAAEQLEGNAERLEGVLRTAAQHSEETLAYAKETLEAAQAIAAGSQQLSASITEISRQASESDQAVQAVKSDVGKALDATKALMGAAKSIDQVIVFIRDIADKTNLLALNATIEAARAGDAGKGFAVVASEVKALASQTAKATEDIARQIESMQAATTATANAIEEIDHQSDTVTQVVAAIASAVEEQSAATGEISEHLQNTTSKVEEMLEKLTEIHRTAGENFRLAEEIGSAAEALSGQADTMRDTGAAFLASMRGEQARAP